MINRAFCIILLTGSAVWLHLASERLDNSDLATIVFTTGALILIGGIEASDK